MRAAVEVRPAGRDDLVVVAELAAQGIDEAPTAVQAAQAGHSRLLEHLSVLIASGGTVLLATHEGRASGFLVMRVLDPMLFAATASASVDTIYVVPQDRRRGVARALLAAAANLAAERGAEHVYCAPAPGARGMQRFLARLGFAPASGHRVVPTTVLQRRLAQEVPHASRAGRMSRRDATRAAIEDLVARRRRARAAGLPTGPVDLRDFHAQREEMLRESPDLIDPADLPGTANMIDPVEAVGVDGLAEPAEATDAQAHDGSGHESRRRAHQHSRSASS